MGVMWLDKLHLLICTVVCPQAVRHLRSNRCQICSYYIKNYTLYTVACSLGCFNCKQPPTILGTGNHVDKIVSKALISQPSTQLLLKDEETAFNCDWQSQQVTMTTTLMTRHINTSTSSLVSGLSPPAAPERGLQPPQPPIPMPLISQHLLPMMQDWQVPSSKFLCRCTYHHPLNSALSAFSCIEEGQ